MDLPCCQPAREGGAHSLFDRMKRNIYARALVRSCARAWQAHRQLARARGDFIAWKRFGRCPHPHPHGPRLRVRLQKAFSIVSPCRAVPCRAVPCRAVPCRAAPRRAVPPLTGRCVGTAAFRAPSFGSSLTHESNGISAKSTSHRLGETNGRAPGEKGRANMEIKA